MPRDTPDPELIGQHLRELWKSLELENLNKKSLLKYWRQFFTWEMYIFIGGN